MKNLRYKGHLITRSRSNCREQNQRFDYRVLKPAGPSGCGVSFDGQVWESASREWFTSLNDAKSCVNGLVDSAKTL